MVAGEGGPDLGTKLVEEITREVVAALTPAIRRLVAAAVAEQPGAPAEEEAGRRGGAGPGPLLTAKQVSAMLQLPPARIYALAREGKLPRSRSGSGRCDSKAMRSASGCDRGPRSRRARAGGRAGEAARTRPRASLTAKPRVSGGRGSSAGRRRQVAEQAGGVPRTPHR